MYLLLIGYRRQTDENNIYKMNVNTETDSTLKERVNDILDSLNALPDGDDIRVNRIDILFTSVSIVSRVMSIISTLLLALFYYHNNKIDHFTWTLCCFIIPMFVTMFLQLSMYVPYCAEQRLHLRTEELSNCIFQLLWRSAWRDHPKIEYFRHLLVSYHLSHSVSVRDYSLSMENFVKLINR